MSSEPYDVNLVMASSVMMGEKNKPGTAPRIPQTTPQMLQPDSGFRFSLDESFLPTTGSSWTTSMP